MYTGLNRRRRRSHARHDSIGLDGRMLDNAATGRSPVLATLCISLEHGSLKAKL